jgi:hypothetical protein
MNEDWEQNLKPESIKVSENLTDRDDGMMIKVPIVSKKCNWDDHAWNIANKLFGWIWRR